MSPATGRVSSTSHPTRRPPTQPCIRLKDSSRCVEDASWLSQGPEGRDPAAQHARLADQFVRQNQAAFRVLDLDVQVTYDGSRVGLAFQAGSAVGALPLIAPTSGRLTLGIVVQPRFGWDGIGSAMGQTGWKVVPNLLKMPMLPRSARDVPPWVLSSVVLIRLRDLLDRLQRRFEFNESIRSAPRGTVVWQKYICTSIPTGHLDRVPCRYPDLRDDSRLLSAAHFALLRQAASLQSQRGAAVVVTRLLDMCTQLLRRVQHVPPLRPTPQWTIAWLRHPTVNTVVREGIEAIEWTADERGLAGLTDLSGIPWRMSMEEFFEALVETLSGSIARRIGGVLRSGRSNQTVVPISWDPPFSGSQRSLRPDVVVNCEGHTVILDAKYKSHGEEISVSSWSLTTDEVRERHRTDLLQVLAYANLSETLRTTVVIVYPCNLDLWDRLRQDGRVAHRAELHTGYRRVSVLLFLLPLSGERCQEACDVLSGMLTA